MKAKTKKLKATPEFRARVTVVTKPLDDLKPHPKNPRKHPERGTPEYNNLRASLAHDYFDPIVWNKRNGMLVGGHLRTKVLRDLGYTHADVVVVDYDEKTHLARMLAANKNAGEFDNGTVAEILGDLTSKEIDLSGFTFAQATDIINDETMEHGVSALNKVEPIDLTPVEVPVWFVVRAPMSQASRIKAHLAKIHSEEIVVEASV